MHRWEKFFTTRRSPRQRLVVALLLAVTGFALTYWAHAATGFYFTSLVIVTVIAIALECGTALTITFAFLLCMSADYFFIPPVGTVLTTRAGWEHLAIILTITTFAAITTSWFRTALRDMIIARQEAERARREADAASKAMEKMLALVSHDVRNPLASVKMASQLLFMQPPQSDKEGELRAMLSRNLAQVDSMVQSILDVASVRAGKTILLELESCDLVAEVRRMIADQTPSIASRLELVADESLWGKWGIKGIRRAVQNLVTNAVKYGAPASTIVIALHQADGRATLAVHNDGDPIPPADQTHIFEAFERTHRSEASHVAGWGLGLAVVRAIADAHGGRATVESREGTGTTFTLDLPIRAA